RPEPGPRAVRRAAVERHARDHHVAVADLVAAGQQPERRRASEARRLRRVHLAADRTLLARSARGVRLALTHASSWNELGTGGAMSDLRGGREILIDNQDDLATGVPALDHLVGLGSVVPEVPGLQGDGQGPVVEPRGHPDQAGPARLAVVWLPADALPGGGLGVHGGGDERAVPGRAG